MCLPGLHITLGIFFRLFTLLEDQCHALDLELAAITNPAAGDRPSYMNYSAWVTKERTLLDSREKVQKEVDMLIQTLSYLALNTNNPSTDPATQAVSKVIREKKKEISKIVCLKCW